MSLILDSAEIREAIGLTLNLTTLIPVHVEAAALPLGNPAIPEVDPAELTYRGDRLERVILNMCLRSRFIGAVITDMTGLPFAVVNPPVSMEALAAFTTVLGDALKRAGTLLGHHGADFMSMDISYEEKVVLYRFQVADVDYLLLAICPQDVDERSEIEISIEQIISILAAA